MLFILDKDGRFGKVLIQIWERFELNVYVRMDMDLFGAWCRNRWEILGGSSQFVSGYIGNRHL